MTACAPLTVSVSAAAIDSFAGSSSTRRRALLAVPGRPLGSAGAPSWQRPWPRPGARLGRAQGPGSAPLPRQGAPGCSGELHASDAPRQIQRDGGSAPGCSGQLLAVLCGSELQGARGLAIGRPAAASGAQPTPPKPPMRMSPHSAIYPPPPMPRYLPPQGQCACLRA